jgi:hypothetical protein
MADTVIEAGSLLLKKSPKFLMPSLLNGDTVVVRQVTPEHYHPRWYAYRYCSSGDIMDNH